MKQKIKVLIADDHGVVRAGLISILAFEEDIEVVGEAANGIQALKQCEALRPDVVIMDLMMPHMNGVEATARIAAAHPEARILLLTTFSASGEVVQALDAGACGAIVKDSSQKDLVAAIRAVAAGNRVVSPEISRTIAGVSSKPQLSERHRAILDYVAKGLSNPEIGKLLGMNPITVRSRLSRALKALRSAAKDLL